MESIKSKLTLIFFFVFSSTVSAQVIEIRTSPPPPPGAPLAVAPADEQAVLFGKGLLNMNMSGQLEASAQVLKIRIGEPDGFNVPFYLFTGATSTTFGDGADNETTVTDLISPTGGFINGSFTAYIPLYLSISTVTQLKFSTLAGGRLVSGRQESSREINILGSGYFDGGLLFQTAAWEDNGSYKEGGIFWTQLKYAASLSSLDKMKDIFGEEAENPHGFRIEAGILIKDKVNMKLGAYIPQAGERLPTLDTSAWKIALDYNISK